MKKSIFNEGEQGFQGTKGIKSKLKLMQMAYIRKVKTASGATAIQIVRKQKGEIINLSQIGSAHTEEELQVLLSIANKLLQVSKNSVPFIG